MYIYDVRANTRAQCYAPSPQSDKSKRCASTPSQLANSGKIKFGFVEGGVSALGTVGDVFGSFETTGGYRGTFHTTYEGIIVGGRGLSVAVGVGYSKSLATFQGVNYNLVGTLGPYSISDNFDPNSGQHVGQTDAGSTPGLGIGGTRSVTTLTSIVCPR